MRQQAAAAAPAAVPTWSLGDRLRKARGKRPQSEMGFVVRKSPAAIGAWENDINRPDANAIEKWANHTGVALWWFYGFDTDPGDEVLEAVIRSRCDSGVDQGTAA